MADTPACVFCRIVRGESPAALVYEDEATLAFLDILPAAPGHVLVIPRAHVADIYDLDETTGGAVMRTTVRVAQALRRALNPPGLSVLQRNGRAAGQAVFHLHVHVIPRRPGDSVGFALQQGRTSAADLSAIAGQVRQALG